MHVYPSYYKNFSLFTEYKNDWKQKKIRQQKNKATFTITNKKIFNIDDVDINKILVSKKE